MAYRRGSSLVVQREYSYDELGRPTSRNTARQGAVVNDVFAHNSRSELSRARVNGVSYGYAYDSIGNRAAAVEDSSGVASRTEYTANALNQYTRITENAESVFIPEFDADGNQTRIKTETGIWGAVYNSENRPVTFSNADSGIVVESAYDSMGRRTYKRFTLNGNVTLHQRYIYRGYLQIACIDLTRSHHPALWFITWDPTQSIASRPLAIQKDGTWYTYGLDLTKNVCEVFGTTGYINTAYTYTPYGSVTATGNTTQPIQWSSEFYDSELGLVYYNYRYYNKCGKFTTRDILKNGYTKCNLYDYVKQSPIFGIDSLGLELYAIDGTSFTEKNNGNVLLFKQRYKHGKAFYWDGPQNRVTGSDSGEISITVYDFICKRFCLNRRRKIDIIGWSRGAAIAIDVVNRLATHGCTCCGKSYKPQIHWLGLLDPVDMSIIWNGNSLKVNSIPSNVQQGVAIYAEDRGIKQTYDLLCFIPIFPESAQQIDMYLAKGASHNDVGGTGEQDPKINKEVLNFITQHIDNSYSK